MLYFLPTPIGNLDDISKHCLDILELCEIIICEDTRVTKSLINLLNSKFDKKIKPKEFHSLHSHNESEFLSKFDVENFDKICVYVSDAGMPCISDPGSFLVDFAIKNDIKYEVLSGSNALLLAVAGSGFVKKEFVFLGFLPSSGSERDLALQNALTLPYPCVIYESPKRIIKLISQICKIDENRKIYAIKEATKKFETKFHFIAKDMLNALNLANLNGEWVVVVDNANLTTQKITTQDILDLELPPKQKSKLLAKISGKSAKEHYEELISKKY